MSSKHVRAMAGGGLGRAFAATWTVIAALLIGTPTKAQSATERQSLSDAAAQGSGTSDQASVSRDGRFIVFRSAASNLVVGDTNGVADIFVRDRWTGLVERVSVSSSGLQANGESKDAHISADGRWVVFASLADNLSTEAPANWPWDVFVHDRTTRTTRLVSRGATGAASNGDCYFPTVSDDGRFVAFEGSASNLVSGTTTSGVQVFRRDMLTGSTVLVTASLTGTSGNGFSYNGAISSDGRYVAFVSLASNLVANDTNNFGDCFRRDISAGTTQRVSVSSGGAQGAGTTWQRCAMSADGRWIAFASGANLAPGEFGVGQDVFLHDALSVQTYRISVNSANAASNGASFLMAVSNDGRFVAFDSEGTNLDPLDADTDRDVFVRDRQRGTTTLVSRSSSQGSNGWSEAPSISGNGEVVAFASAASNLVPMDTNGVQDVFLRSLGYVVPDGDNHTSFCAGTSSACPCGNAGSDGAGCENSAQTGGGLLRAIGGASVSAPTLTLLATRLPPQSSVAFFQGTQRQNGGAGSAFGDGLRCAGGTVARLCTFPVVAAAASAGHGAPGACGAPLNLLGGNVPAGATRTYQVWYRNSATFCTSERFNLTNGVEVTWTN